MVRLKTFIILIILIILAVGGLVFYGYRQTPPLTDDHCGINNGDQIGGSCSINSETLAPAIEVTPLNYDLGTVKYGEVAKHTFTIKNSGAKPLEILRVSTSCGCTQAFLADADKIIVPDETVEMLVTFDPAVHQDDSDLGKIVRMVYLKTNDPKKSEVEIELTANVVKDKEVKTISVEASKWFFRPDSIKIKKGDFVRLEITSTDVAHGFALPAFNIKETIESGKKTITTFLADKSGVFDFFCFIPCGAGHSEMKGQLIIE